MTRSHWWWALAPVPAPWGQGRSLYSSPFLAVPLVNHFLHGFFAKRAHRGIRYLSPGSTITDATAQAVAPILALVRGAKHGPPPVGRGRRRVSL